jgi:hypothetical protein
MLREIRNQADPEGTESSYTQGLVKVAFLDKKRLRLCLNPEETQLFNISYHIRDPGFLKESAEARMGA